MVKQNMVLCSGLRRVIGVCSSETNYIQPTALSIRVRIGRTVALIPQPSFMSANRFRFSLPVPELRGRFFGCRFIEE